MTDNETQPFDQATYDAILYQMHTDHPEEYRLKGHGPLNFQIGAEKAAKIAARLAAARQPDAAPVVGGEAQIFDRLMALHNAETDDDVIEGMDNHDMHYAMGYKAAMGDAAAILAAQAVQVPDLSDDALIQKARKMFIAFADSEAWDMTYGEDHTPDGESSPTWVISPDALRRFATIWHECPDGDDDAIAEWWERATAYAQTGLVRLIRQAEANGGAG